MKHPKVWAVLGGHEGLGLAAIKYLVSKKQIVIVLTDHSCNAHPLLDSINDTFFIIDKSKLDIIAVDTALQDIKGRYGGINFIVNNNNHKLFDDLVSMMEEEAGEAIANDINRTVEMIGLLLPYLCKDPKGSLINIPPQLCLTSIKNRKVAGFLAGAMEVFLDTLQPRLAVLDCKLHFLQPNERPPGFKV